jgi:hypothetical protein
VEALCSYSQCARLYRIFANMRLCSVGTSLEELPMMSESNKEAKPRIPKVVVAVLFTCAVAFIWPNLVRAKAQGQLTECKGNIKNIGTALEMYSTDWKGKYPSSGLQVTPDYLETMPVCPAAQKPTYTFEFGEQATGNEDRFKDYFYVYCRGTHHSAVSVPENHPYYTSQTSMESELESRQERGQ